MSEPTREMAMLKIWGRTNSLNVQKALLCLEEIGLPYVRIDAGLHFGVNDTPAYRAMNPNGLVPTIDDDGFVLWESNSIVRYLAATHSAGAIWLVDAKQRALAERWMDWQLSAFIPAINAAFLQLVRTPPAQRQPDAIEASRKAGERAVAILDAHLEGRDWLAGDQFTIAECAIAPVAHRWLHLPMAREPRPNIERWYASVMQRTAAQKVLLLPLT